ncbi:hypothetical protein SBV1_970028 [Verrucomicrobia bacterium]|nr:hypothetical protein SBV1_970028 [Verrucomicrobiota bacterium]
MNRPLNHAPLRKPDQSGRKNTLKPEWPNGLRLRTTNQSLPKNPFAGLPRAVGVHRRAQRIYSAFFILRPAFGCAGPG